MVHSPVSAVFAGDCKTLFHMPQMFVAATGLMIDLLLTHPDGTSAVHHFVGFTLFATHVPDTEQNLRLGRTLRRMQFHHRVRRV